MSRRRRLVCVTSQRWDDGMWTNKQHIMSRLGRDHDVLYVNAGTAGVWPGVRPRIDRPHPKVTALDFYQPVQITRRLPPHHPASAPLVFDLRTELLRRELKRRRIRRPIVWVYHPGYGARVATLPHALVVYDCVDEYSAFPDYRDQPGWLIKREEALIKRADLVFTTSRPLYERKRTLNPERTHLVHNVGDAEHFAAAADPAMEPPRDLARLPGPRVVFVGAVSGYKLNMEWLAHLADARPSWSIVVIGPEGVGDASSSADALRRAKNVHLLGHRPYETLPAYLSGADVTVIPYRLNRYTESCFPIKFFEMLATGKPVVISRLPSLAAYYDAVRVADDADGFVAACDAALEDEATEREARVALAQQNSWSARVARLMELIESELAARDGV